MHGFRFAIDSLMGTSGGVREFRLEPIPAFDARRGYRKCVPSGIGVRVGREQKADACFWRDRAGGLVVRCSSQGYRMHLSAMLADAGPVPESAMDDFCDHVAQTLRDWMAEGVDGEPNSICAT
jgi:hypothetical protein